MAGDTNRDIRPESRQSSGSVCRRVSTVREVELYQPASEARAQLIGIAALARDNTSGLTTLIGATVANALI